MLRDHLCVAERKRFSVNDVVELLEPCGFKRRGQSWIAEERLLDELAEKSRLVQPVREYFELWRDDG